MQAKIFKKIFGAVLFSGSKSKNNKRRCFVFMGFILQERDKLILQQVTKYRFLLSRQIKILCNFTGQRSCDRRTRKLIDEGLLEKKHFLYGVPALYLVTEKAKRIFDLGYITKNIRVEYIKHDILVIDTAIYLNKKFGIPLENIKSERQIKHGLGFGNPKHVPDLLYKDNNKTYCVEIELSVKTYKNLENNVRLNSRNYNKEIWYIDTTKTKLVENLDKLKIIFGKVVVIDINEVIEYVKTL